MANREDIKLNILTSEQRKELATLAKKIDESQKVLDLLSELGLGVSDMQAKLNWAKKRNTLLLEKG